jgi:diguanylate cyclase (GGDEF)-like protein
LLAAIMAVVTLVLVFVFKRTVLDRVSRLEQVVRKARKGDYGPARSMATGPQDEIGRLSSALTEMAENVDQTTRDLEERVQERTQELERLAFRDWQSGLLNRRGFTEAHRRAADAGEPYGVLLADVDHFKQINDSAGHGAGDLVIVDVARRIEACIGPGASVGRWGGDEFIIFLPKSSPHGLRATADDILHAVMDEGIKVSPEQTLAVSLSIGAFLAEGGVELEISTDRADAALYMAKEAGRGRVVVVDKDIRPKPPLQVA